jgi:PAS domain S-box-containing protein
VWQEVAPVKHRAPRKELTPGLLWDAVPDLMYRVRGPEGTIELLSAAFATLTGWSSSEWIGRPFADLVLADDLPRAIEAYAAILLGGRPAPRRLRIRTKGGGFVFGEFHGAPFVERGRVVGEQGIARDVTDRRHEAEARHATQERFRTLFESADEALLLMDGAIFVDVNPKCVEMFGLGAASEMVGHSPPDYSPPLQPDGRESREKALELVLATLQGCPQRFYWKHARKDGSTFDAEVSLHALTLHGRVHVQATVRDTTARRAAEQAMRESEERFRVLAAQVPADVWVTDTDLRLTSIYGALAPLLDRPELRKAGVSLYELFATSDESHPVIAAHRRALRGVTVQYERASGLLTIEGRVEPLRDAGGSVVGCVGVALDVTERRTAQTAVRRLAHFVESSQDAIVTTALDGTIETWNPAAERLYGYPAREAIGRPITIIAPPDGAAEFERNLQRLAQGQPVGPYETQRVRSDGRIVSVSVTLSGIRDSRGALVGSSGITRDITARKQAEEALRASEAEFRSLVEHAPLGIYRVIPDGRFLTVNPALIRMLGYGDAQEMSRLDIVRDVYADPQRQGKPYTAFAERDEAGTETEWKRKDGSRITVRVILRTMRGPDGQVECYEGMVEDVTEQRNLETQFRQAQRLEAVGRLAGGVAHDFNNVLTAITGYSDLLLEDLGSDDRKRTDVEEIKAAALRASALTRQLLAFSRKQVLETRVLDLNEVVQTLDKMLRRLIGEDVKLELALAPRLGAVRADPGQIEQVILNLAVNSRDAMPHGGRLTIETANAELDEGYVRGHAGASKGRHTMLAVSDTGTGMDAETRSHIFEPFFTTKEEGKGTGLGLATVYGIVKQSGGHVWAYSEPGRGTTFKIYLPQVDERPDATSLPAPAQPVTGGRETVLLAEDDPSVRAVVSDTLAQKGYQVLRAPDGPAALEIARAHPAPIQLLVTDIVMPGMTGRELAETLMAERPGLRVLYMSGYTDDAVVRHGVLQEGMPYLQKPFAPRALASKVREVLDEA